jgi:HKD family nuclease
MLEPKNKDNQIDYSELLKPPHGSVLERAIGTTYTLDLHALLAVPVAMYYGKSLETDFEKDENPFDVFDAISKASKTVTIFCQKGKVKVPKKFNKLLSFTEDCVKEITPSGIGSSFHPKCWWLWFKNPKSKLKTVRFVVLSRNLTFDRSWDVSFSFDGEVGDEIKNQNKPMVELLEYLENSSDIKIDKQFKSDLLRANFDIKSDLPFKTWSFYPIGISEAHQNPLSSNYLRPDVLLMMSPFVDDKTTINIADKATDKTWLFSRKTELRKLKDDTFEHLSNQYCIPDIIVDGEMNDKMVDEMPNVEPEPLDMHAKLFISRKGNTNTWLLGSANLTSPAFGRNIECLIELKTDDSLLSPETIYKELVSTEKEKKLFEEYTPVKVEIDKVEEDVKQAIRRLEYEIISCPFSGKAIVDNSGIYFTYEVEFDATTLKPSIELKVYIQPYSITLNADEAKQIKPAQQNTLFFEDKVKESHLSKYFIVSITYIGKLKKSFLLKAEMDLSASQRESKIFAEIISSKEKFLQFLRFLLSDTGIVPDSAIPLTNGNTSNNENNHEQAWQVYNIPLYEELLKVVSQQPDKFRSIDNTFTKLIASDETKDRIPTELLDLWKLFKDAIQ